MSKTKVKPTNAQIEQRVEDVAFLLARGASKGVVHRVIGPKYSVHWRTVDRYMARARAVLLKAADRSRDEAKAEAVSFYQSVLISEKATTREKLIARMQMDFIYGLHEARRTELSGPGGKPLQVETKQEANFDISTLSKEDILAIDAQIGKAARPPRFGQGN